MATVNLKNIAWMAMDLDEIGVFLYWLYRDVPSKYARTVLFKIQYFFAGEFLLTDKYYDLYLYGATDYILRFIYANPVYPGKPPYVLSIHSYRKDMADALSCIYKFCKSKDLFFPFDEQTIAESRQKEINVGDIVDKLVETIPETLRGYKQEYKQGNALLLDFNFQIYKYIQEYKLSGSYVVIPKRLIETLKDLIEPILNKYNLYIPGPNSRVFEIWTKDLWENTKKHDL